MSRTILSRPPLEVNCAERRKKDLVTLAYFGATTGHRWLVRDALLAMRRETLLIPELSHIQLPAAILDDPAPYLVEALRGDVCWIVAEGYDALRLESYGFPSLAIDERCHLGLEDLQGASWVILLQRPGEEQPMAGLDVRAELLALGWAGRLTTIELPFIDLEEAEQALGEDFGPWLASLVLDGRTQDLAGERSIPANGKPRHGLRTIAAGEVSSWRR
jgi:hypothetical protein